MSPMQRSLAAPSREDLAERMVLLSGPRQVGKSTLARQVLAELAPRDPVYLTWDRAEDRRAIRNLSWDRASPVAVLDEVHKYPRWKGLVKGFHDTEGARQRLLVTGSARLEVYRRGGDSLLGRYARHRLHPLTIGEVGRSGRLPPRETLLDPSLWPAARPVPNDLLGALLSIGGFPEPFLRASARFGGKWRLLRRDQVLREDVRDLTQVRDLAGLEHLTELLAERVGAPVSVNNLREDLEVEYRTVRNWLEILDRLFVVFRVPPFAGSLARALRKEGKVYFWDAAEAPEGGPRFENLVACHLLRLCQWLEDVEGIRAELRFVRDREKREVDFLLLRERRPWVLVEAKQADLRPAPAIEYFRRRLGVPFAFQVVAAAEARKDVVPAVRLFAALP